MKATLADFYLQYLNDFLTYRAFALHHEMPYEDAIKLLELGRKYHEERTET